MMARRNIEEVSKDVTDHRALEIKICGRNLMGTLVADSSG
jgi:hypothetical protein